MPRVILLVPGSTYRAADFVAAAGELDLDVVVASEEPGPGTGLVVDVDDPAAVVAAVESLDRQRPVDAVLAVDDRGVPAAAAAAARLGLPHASPEAVADACDKLRTRHRLDRAEVPQPRFAAVRAASPDDLRQAAAAVGFPCVIKPTTLSASRGVIRADDVGQLERAAARSAAIAAGAGVPVDQPLLVEAFVPGPEVAVEGVLQQGRLRVLAVFDKPDPLDGPYFDETIYVTPSRLPPADHRAVEAATAAACRALGLDHGPVHAELRVTEGRASVIEVAARTIGGLCGRTLEIGTGRRLEAVVLANALGRSLPAGRRRRAAGVLMVPPPAAGRFRGLAGADAARAVPGIRSVEITVPPGAPVAPAPDGDRYVAFVFATGLTPQAAEAALRRAWDQLTVEVGP